MDYNADYNKIADLVSARLGVTLNPHRYKILRDHLERLASEGNDLIVIFDMLSHSSEEAPLWQNLIEVMTIGETYFFRNKAHFHALRHDVLPGLIAMKRRDGNKVLRLWSAGCATGEEPYSIAILLRDLLPDIDTWTIDLLATDLNEDFLDRARTGCYRPHAFRGETPEWVQRRWFKVQEGGYQLLDTVREMVHFAPLNLITGDFPSIATGTYNLDLIICRNVTIYFDRAQTMNIVNRFYDALSDGGWLVVGHSEPQAEVYDSFITRNFENAIFYQKSEQSVDELHEPVFYPLQSSLPAVEQHVMPEILSAIPQVAATEQEVELTVSSVSPDMLELWDAAREAADTEAWGLAFQLLDEAEQLDMLQPQTHYLRALIYMQMDNMQSAVYALRQALYCDPAFALAHYTLGELYEKTGAVAEAERHWKRAQNVLSGFAPQEALPFTSDLTVEMLNGLLDYRLNQGRR